MNLFAYGTLTLPSIFAAVTGRSFFPDPARLYDYARYRVKGKTYPGLIPQKHAVTGGVVYHSVDPSSMEKIDRFEGGLYQRIRLRVLLENGAHLPAQVYVIRPEHRNRLSGEPWSIEKFKRFHQQHFLDSYSGFSGIR